MEEQREPQPSSPRQDGEVEEANKENEVHHEEDDGERNLPPSRHLYHAQARSAGSHLSFFGKHKIQAALSNLNNQIHILEEELQQLETFGRSSAVCGELISAVESLPDPLLPWTKVPAGVSWDQWFTGANHSRSHKRWR